MELEIVTKEESDQAAAQLYRLAQATALIRAARTGASIDTDENGHIRPSDAD
jgi:hypothetical protein